MFDQSYRRIVLGAVYVIDGTNCNDATISNVLSTHRMYNSICRLCIITLGSISKVVDRITMWSRDWIVSID